MTLESAFCFRRVTKRASPGCRSTIPVTLRGWSGERFRVDFSAAAQTFLNALLPPVSDLNSNEQKGRVLLLDDARPTLPAINLKCLFLRWTKKKLCSRGRQIWIHTEDGRTRTVASRCTRNNARGTSLHL